MLENIEKFIFGIIISLLILSNIYIKYHKDKLQTKLYQCEKEFQDYKTANLQIANDNLNKVIENTNKATNNYINRKSLENKIILNIATKKETITEINEFFNKFNLQINKIVNNIKDNKECELCIK